MSNGSADVLKAAAFYSSHTVATFSLNAPSSARLRPGVGWPLDWLEVGGGPSEAASRDTAFASGYASGGGGGGGGCLRRGSAIVLFNECTVWHVTLRQQLNSASEPAFADLFPELSRITAAIPATTVESADVELVSCLLPLQALLVFYHNQRLFHLHPWLPSAAPSRSPAPSSKPPPNPTPPSAASKPKSKPP